MRCTVNLTRRLSILSCLLAMLALRPLAAQEEFRPNIVLIMADDQGWGETSYMGHPILKTPNIDAMAANGLRLDRFYAGAPVCSPTRATVLTGRSNRRCGTESHGYPLRLQEKTLPRALKAAGYQTGHFGKWHLNGMRGPGVPILSSDSHHPGAFGFDRWYSVTNFFDRDPIMSRRGEFIESLGDSSELAVAEALGFISEAAQSKQPSFSVIWFGSPHSPWVSIKEDQVGFEALDNNSRNHYAELVAMDRAIGQLRAGLRELEIANDTLVWYCSDNGGLPRITPETVGGLRGFTGTVYEGGLRVPCVVEWPERIEASRISHYPSCTMDIFPTIAAVLGLEADCMLEVTDGIDISDLFESTKASREKPIPFSCLGKSALIDNEIKIVEIESEQGVVQELYDLSKDPAEQDNLMQSNPQLAAKMKAQLEAWQSSMERSIAGLDYPEGRLLPGDPEPRDWLTVKDYEPYFEEWKKRREYAPRFK